MKMTLIFDSKWIVPTLILVEYQIWKYTAFFYICNTAQKNEFLIKHFLSKCEKSAVS